MRLGAFSRTAAASTVANSAAIAAGSAVLLRTTAIAAANAVLLLLPPPLLPQSQQPLKLCQAVHLQCCPCRPRCAARGLARGGHSQQKQVQATAHSTAGGTPRAHTARAH